MYKLAWIVLRYCRKLPIVMASRDTTGDYGKVHKPFTKWQYKNPCYYNDADRIASFDVSRNSGSLTNRRIRRKPRKPLIPTPLGRSQITQRILWSQGNRTSLWVRNIVPARDLRSLGKPAHMHDDHGVLQLFCLKYFVCIYFSRPAFQRF